MEEAKAAQAAAGTPLLVAFGGKYCKPCKEMAKTVFKDPAVDGLFRTMVLADLETQDGDDMDKNLAILDEIAGTDEVPYYVLYDRKGELKAKIKGKQSVGAFLNFLKQVEAD
tara:strand:- start:427 stop:762 length:336 start_codon:yes stop_codon:yes gene_type:complete